MKAIVLSRYGRPEDLGLQDLPRPEPRADQVRIRVGAASVNDWDWALVRGKPFYIRLLCGLLRPRVRIPGVDVAGRVDAVGADVRGLSVGDEVYGDLSDSGFGAFAEYVCAPETALALKPRNLSFVEAAAIPHAGLLALQALRDLGRLRAGHRLLINGAGGGVGTLGVQIARATGVTVISGVDGAHKSELMRAAGFERTIDFRQADFTRLDESWDVVLDPKTDRPPSAYLRALKPGGHYVTVGGSTGRLLQLFLSAGLLRRLTGKSLRLLALQPNRDLNDLTALIESGKLRPFNDGPYRPEHAI